MNHLIGAYFFFAIYTSIPLIIGSTAIPNGASLLAAPLLIWVAKGKLVSSEFIIIVYIVVSILFLSTLHLFSGLAINAYFDSSLLLILGIVLGYLFFNAASFVETERLSKILLAVIVFIITGMIFEVSGFGYVAEISDLFRHYFFEGHMYTSDLRDISLHGGIRPKFFTSEPSHVAKYLCVFIVCWWLISQDRNKNYLVIFFTLLGTILLRSPQMVAIPVAFIAIYICRPNIGFKNRTIRFVLVFTLISLSVLFLYLMAREMLPARIFMILNGEDNSLYQRLFAPMILTEATFTTHPWLGYGVGSSASLDTIIKENLGMSLAGGTTFEQLRSVANAFFAHWISFGIFGGIVLGALYAKLLHELTGESGTFLAIALVSLFALQQGGYNGSRIWFFFFLVAIVIRRSNFPRLPLQHKILKH